MMCCWKERINLEFKYLFLKEISENFSKINRLRTFELQTVQSIFPIKSRNRVSIPNIKVSIFAVYIRSLEYVLE